uniref:Uncharacterized protein n=1 Tax=Globodera pallida TaxID=36090 RepID=A0A183CJE5_GLOPA
MAKLTTEFCQNKSIIKAVCTECDSYRCIPNSVGFSDSGCCPEDNEYRCCSMDRLPFGAPTTTTTTTTTTALTTTAPTTTTTEMSTTTTTEPEQEKPSASTEPSSTAENGAEVETISSTTIFCLGIKF